MQPPAEPDHPAPEREPGGPAPGPSPERLPGTALDTAPATPAIRASDRERDAAVQQLRVAFAEGRIDDQELDERMRAALVARTRVELVEARPTATPRGQITRG